MKQELVTLLGRVGFGLTDTDRKTYGSLTYEQCVESLCAELTTVTSEPPLDPFQEGACEQAWLTRILSGKNRLGEKITLFWHGHFATSNLKVANMELMWRQHNLFRRLGAGPFEELLLGVSQDPAMLLWLDNHSNLARSPNENYAREVMELFCLGRGHYSEADVQELARAFTGWSCRLGRFTELKKHHDRGSKTILGKTGPWSGRQAVKLISSHPRCPLHLAERLARFLAGEKPPAHVSRRVAHSRIDRMVHSLLLDPWFRRGGSRVKSPLEFLAGALREQGATKAPEWAPDALAEMGQALFYPPSVKGWDGGLSWLTAGRLLHRFQTASRLKKTRLAEPDYQIV